MKNSQRGLAGLVLLIIALLLIAGVVYFYSQKSQTSEVETNFQIEALKTYTNEKYKYSFQYPSDWVLRSDEVSASVLTKAHDAVKDNPSGQTVDFSVSACDLTTRTCQNTKAEYLALRDKPYGQPYKSEITIDGKKGFQVVLIGANAYHQIVIEDKGTLYVLSHATQEDLNNYPDNFADKTVKQIIDTVKLN